MTARLRSRLLPAVLPACACALLAATAHAQSLRPPESSHTIAPLPVTIRYEERHRRVADKIAEICDAEIPRIAGDLGLEGIRPIEIVVTAEVALYNRTGRDLPTWGVAFAVLDEQRILVDVERATRAYNSLDEVIPHELSHLLLRQRVPHAGFPLWFLEGLAQWQAGEWSLVDSWQLMNAVWSRTAPGLSRLTRYYPADEEQARSAYRVSYAAFTELFSEDFGALPRFLAEVEAQGDFDAAFTAFWGFTSVDYAAYFQDRLDRRYRSRLLVFQTGPLFSFASVVFVLVIVRFYLRRRRKLKELDGMDAPGTG